VLNASPISLSLPAPTYTPRCRRRPSTTRGAKFDVNSARPMSFILSLSQILLINDVNMRTDLDFNEA
jgi:hypothetical protein